MEGRQPVWEELRFVLEALCAHEITKFDAFRAICELILQPISDEEKRTLRRLLQGDILWLFEREVDV